MSASSQPGQPGLPEVDPVHVQTRFERFPTSIRGALVFRGADGNPHAVRIVDAGLARLPRGRIRGIQVEDRPIDVAPARDLFVPFEIPVTDLEPAWYSIESSIQVDGGRTYRFAGRPFTLPWPRSDVRRGTILVGETVAAGRHAYVIDRIDLTADCAVVSWRAGSGAADEPRPEAGGASDEGGEALLLADGKPLEALPLEAGGRAASPSPGEARTVTYPVPRECRSLALVMVTNAGQRSKPVTLRLP